jgi:REP element-mobilizing transposase RayT
MARFRKRSCTRDEYVDDRHRFEHWYRDNTVYFITARCRDRFHAFETEEAKQVFWDRFEHYRSVFEFVPWIVTLMVNHYHVLGYLRIGENLGPMMQRLHGSVAKLVNDTLEERHVPFWRERGRRDYFDGCLRDQLQCRRAFRYTYLQSVRAGVVRDAKDYPHTRIYIDVERGIRRALELNAFMEGVPYKRYER